MPPSYTVQATRSKGDDVRRDDAVHCRLADVVYILNGSASPIGGQKAVIKLRWGATRAEELFFEGAMPGITRRHDREVKIANLLVKQRDLFDERMEIKSVFVEVRRQSLDPPGPRRGAGTRRRN